MATLTLLEMTQDILSAMNDDDVDSITDTESSEQVALTIKETYFDLISQRDWPFLKSKSTLTAVADLANPTKMRFPTSTNKVFWIKYNKKDVGYLDPKEFQDLLDSREVETDVVNSNGILLTQDPTYWTSFDDDYVFFDSIDEDTETSLVAVKAVAHVLAIPSWTHSDAFVPTLPEKMFPLLLADAKGTCFLNNKQTSNAKEERKAQRLRTKMQREAQKNEKGESRTNSAVDYGRN